MRNLINSLIRCRDFLCIWMSYFKTCKRVYDFDSLGVLEVERHQLKRTLASIEKYHYHKDSEHSILWMRIAIRILDRILDESLYVEYDIKAHKYVRKPYVNVKNYKRFIPGLSEEDVRRSDPDFFEICLYEKKLWYVYNKIRYHYLQGWWE